MKKKRRYRKSKHMHTKWFYKWMVPILVLFCVGGVLIASVIHRDPAIPTGGAAFVESSREPIVSESEFLEVSSKPEETELPVIDESDYVEYNGPIEHIFFHPLVVYPELAFDGDYQAKGMDDYMTTNVEFQRILEELYKNDYILIYPSMIADLKLPPEKKPVIISTDDINYYPYMRENGCNDKLVVGEDGHIASTAVNPKTQKEEIRTDAEVFPILYRFVQEHPDFSHHGAMAIVGLTGYDGILGYRTQKDSPSRAEEMEAVKPVIECLKKDGFVFASHSYAHATTSDKDAAFVRSDCRQWKDEVESLIGPTDLYFFPYGDYPEHGTDAFRTFIDSGFTHLSGVGINTYRKNYEGYWFDDRKNLDGLTFRRCLNQGRDYVNDNGKPSVFNQVWDMMDVDYVFDARRGDTPGQGDFS